MYRSSSDARWGAASGRQNYEILECMVQQYFHAPVSGIATTPARAMIIADDMYKK